MMMQMFPFILASLHWVTMGANAEEPAVRTQSNIFVQGDLVQIPVPESVQDEVTHWRILNDTLDEVRRGTIGAAPIIHPGDLPIGWFRIEFLDEDEESAAFTTAAVLAALEERAGPDSPVCIDIAMSWEADNPLQWAEMTRLAKLANLGWVRDRIRWRDVEPEPGTFISDTKYDVTADLQSSADMKVLQVFHGYPEWALEDDATRNQADLRHVYRFGRSMTERFKGKVHAWQPWNEGNAANFGGLTIDELCSHQKAAYLGFKAGDPDIIVGWAPIGGIDTIRQANGILNNVTWPYYDVYSIHTYAWAHDYDSLWGPSREAAAGREMWVTESDRGMHSDTDSPVDDYTHEYDRLKGEYIPQSYVSSYFAGVTRKFHFILGWYIEDHRGTIQYGLLRKDYTPRISYVALAAVGRFLADGEMLGRWTYNTGENDENIHVYALRARPDGQARDVLVAWTELPEDWPERGDQRAPWMLPDDLTIEAVYDYLGRKVGETPPAELTTAPVYVILPPGEADRLELTPARDTGEYREGEASPIVFQFDTPGTEPELRSRAWTTEPERVFEPGSHVNGQLVVYNFSESTATGTVSITESPDGWEFSQDTWAIELEPMERRMIDFVMTAPFEEPSDDDWIRFEGSFGAMGSPTLAFQVFGQEP